MLIIDLFAIYVTVMFVKKILTIYQENCASNSIPLYENMCMSLAYEREDNIWLHHFGIICFNIISVFRHHFNIHGYDIFTVFILRYIFFLRGCALAKYTFFFAGSPHYIHSHTHTNTHINTYTHVYIYIYMGVCVCLCICTLIQYYLITFVLYSLCICHVCFVLKQIFPYYIIG